MTQEESAALTSKASAMSGRTVVTIVPSSPSTNAARAMTANSIVVSPFVLAKRPALKGLIGMFGAAP